jgi:hypothetical protein
MIRRLMVSLAFGFFAFACGVCAQSNPNLEIGLRPYGSYGGGKIDSVALANGNLSMRIPLFSYPQRGSIPGNLSLQYSNKNWYVFSSCTNTNCFDQWKWNPRTPTGVYINFDGAWGASYTLIPKSGVF